MKSTTVTPSAIKLKSYITQYVSGSAGAEIAGMVADGAFMHNDDAIKRGIDDIQALGADELLLVPATADMAELDAAESIIAARQATG